MTDTVKEVHPNNIIGDPSGSPSNDDKSQHPFINATEAENKLAAIYGIGYGDRGYGQSMYSLDHVDSGSPIGNQIWLRIRNAAASCANHQGTSSDLLPPAAAFDTGSIIKSYGILSQGLGGEYNFMLQVENLDRNRLDFSENDMTLSTNIYSDTKNTGWGNRNNESISTEFKVLFTSEDHARHFFNTGGSVVINLSHPRPENPILRPQDEAWYRGFLENVGSIIFSGKRTTMTGKSGVSYGGGYYGLINSYETIYDVDNVTKTSSVEITESVTSTQIIRQSLVQEEKTYDTLYGADIFDRTIQKIDLQARPNRISLLHTSLGDSEDDTNIYDYAKIGSVYYGISLDGHLMTINEEDLSKSTLNQDRVNAPGLPADRKFYTLDAASDEELYTLFLDRIRSMLYLIRINLKDVSNSVIVGSKYIESRRERNIYSDDNRSQLFSSVFHDGFMYALTGYYGDLYDEYNNRMYATYDTFSINTRTGEFSLVHGSLVYAYISNMVKFDGNIYCFARANPRNSGYRSTGNWGLYHMHEFITNNGSAVIRKTGITRNFEKPLAMFTGINNIFETLPRSSLISQPTQITTQTITKRLIYLTNNIKVEAKRSNYKGVNGSNGMSIDFRVTITDTESSDEISTGTKLGVDIIRCTGQLSGISVDSPTISRISSVFNRPPPDADDNPPPDSDDSDESDDMRSGSTIAHVFDGSNMPITRAISQDHIYNEYLYGIRSNVEDLRRIDPYKKESSLVLGSFEHLNLGSPIRAATTVGSRYFGVTENGKIIEIDLVNPLNSREIVLPPERSIPGSSNIINTALSDGDFLYVFVYVSGNFLTIVRIDVTNTTPGVTSDRGLAATNLNKSWNPVASFYHNGDAYIYMVNSLYKANDFFALRNTNFQKFKIVRGNIPLSYGSSFTGMAKANGIIYAATDTDSNDRSYLYTIDPSNGLATVIGGGDFDIGSNIHALFSGFRES